MTKIAIDGDMSKWERKARSRKLFLVSPGTLRRASAIKYHAVTNAHRFRCNLLTDCI